METNRTHVSCITIIFNEEQFLEDAIRSVLCQSYENWELLLVDDGSTDGSSGIAKRFAEQYPMKVRYLAHENGENRGMSASRNLGLAHARGSVLGFLDADDVWKRDKLERQLAALDANPLAKLVCGPTILWYDWKDARLPETNGIRSLGVQPNRLYNPPDLFVRWLHSEVITPATCSILFRREILEVTGGFEERFQGMYEDQAFLSKVYLKVPVFVMDEALDLYRQHDASACAIASRNGVYRAIGPSSSHRVLLEWLKDYLKDEQIEDPQVLRAFDKALWPYTHPVRAWPRTQLSLFVSRIKYWLNRSLRKTLPAGMYRRLESLRHGHGFFRDA